MVLSQLGSKFPREIFDDHGLITNHGGIKTGFGVRTPIVRGVDRFGELVTRQGNRISSEVCWTGDTERPWRQGHETARAKLVSVWSSAPPAPDSARQHGVATLQKALAN